MNEKNTKKLLQKYPKIFRQHDLSMRETCMCWGLECGDGWFNIIDGLCGYIKNYCEMERYRNIKDWYYYYVKVHNFFMRLIPYQLFSWLHKNYIFGYLLPHTEIYKVDQVEATQVKEKFGGLRFYANHEPTEVSGAIQMAEQMSYKICEVCGSTDNVTQTKGWIITLCEKCMEKRRK